MPANPSSHRGTPSSTTAEQPMTVNQKSAITTMRRKEERRAERMAEIRAQTADGTLVIRQMTDEQHDAAGEAARQTRTRVEARGRARRAGGQ